ERKGLAREQTWRSWEVLMNEREDFGPVGHKAAVRTAPMPERRQHHYRGDVVGAVERRGQRNQLGDAIEAHVRLDLSAQCSSDRGHVRARDRLRFLPNREQDLLVAFREAYVALQVVVA